MERTRKLYVKNKKAYFFNKKWRYLISRSKMNFSLSIVLRFCEFEENVLLLWWSILRHLMQWGNWVTKTDKGVIVTSTNHELGCNSTHARFSRFHSKNCFPPCRVLLTLMWLESFTVGFDCVFFLLVKINCLNFIGYYELIVASSMCCYWNSLNDIHSMFPLSIKKVT